MKCLKDRLIAKRQFDFNNSLAKTMKKIRLPIQEPRIESTNHSYNLFLNILINQKYSLLFSRKFPMNNFIKVSIVLKKNQYFRQLMHFTIMNPFVITFFYLKVKVKVIFSI